MNKVIMTNRKSFLANKDFLVNSGADFDYEVSGSVNKIIYNGKEFIYLDLSSSGGRGHHLNKMFMKDVNDYLEKNKDTMPLWDNNYKEQMFNLNAIEKHLKEPLVMIDINDCYWRTAFLLGYITEKTYIKGKKRKDWKIGRNACIGSLIKTRTIQGYMNGKLDLTKRRIIRTPVEYHYIRNHIIGNVYRMFNTLYEQMGDSFCMFLTDCLVTTNDKKRKVEQFFIDNGYRVKSKPIEFTAIDRKNKRIDWYDFNANRGDTKNPTARGVNRYYMYSNTQVVRSSLVSTDGYFK